MKNLTSKQINQVKELKSWTLTKFHGNTKRVESLLISDIKQVVAKKISRELAKVDSAKKTNIQIVKECLDWSLKCKGSNYFKVMIEGNSGIYYAHPDYQHNDYNKSRLFEKNEQTLKLMKLFNSIVNK
jgi:hypothetical protein